DGESELAKLQAMLKDIEKEPSNVDLATRLIAITLVDNKKAELRALTERRAKLEDELDPARTFSTRIVSEIRAQSSPYFPRRDLFFAAGSLLGLIMGILVALCRDAWVQKKNKGTGQNMLS